MLRSNRRGVNSKMSSGSSDDRSLAAGRKPLRYLWAFSAGDEWTRGWHQRLLARRRERGFDVNGFCVTPDSIGGNWLPFPELDYRWRTADPSLLEMYASLRSEERRVGKRIGCVCRR